MESNKKIFIDVVSSNTNTLTNIINTASEEWAILKLANNLTEDQARKEAVKFFYSCLAKRLSEHLTL